jgi:hypothetical protein
MRQAAFLLSPFCQKATQLLDEQSPGTDERMKKSDGVLSDLFRLEDVNRL